jgi:hypothetical protein
MRFLGFGGRADTFLVAVTFEGRGHLRLNGNHVKSGRKSRANAASHGRTVCWVEFAPDGTRRADGLGPMAACLGDGGAERLLRELPQTPAFREVLGMMERGQASVGKWLPWGDGPLDSRGGVGGRG